MNEADARPTASPPSGSPIPASRAAGAGEQIPVVGRPSPPPPALVVAVASHLTDAIRRARLRQFIVNTVGITVGTSAAAGVALAFNHFSDQGRMVAFAEASLLGVLLVLGVVMRRRPLEIRSGLISRTARGGLAVGSSARALALVVPGAFREAAEGLIYIAGLIKADPAAELAAWLLLALCPPHGPEAGEWASLSGLSSAGLFSLPEDLTAALRALRTRKWIEDDATYYPPRIRMTPEGAAFVEGMFGRRG
jgi:hypothetical protein